MAFPRPASLLAVVAFGIAVSASAPISYAQQKSFPIKPVRWVTVGAGSQNDLLARIITLRDFIALGQAKPGQILFSSAGAGSGTHMNGERFRLAAGIKATHVGFKSSADALIEVVAGRIHYCVCPMGPALPFVKDGRLVALGVAQPERSPLLPDAPAMREVLPGYERDGSFVLMAPAATPRTIVSQISKDVARVLQLPEVNSRLQAMGFVAAPTAPEEIEKIVRKDIATFNRVGKLVGLIAP